jgi:hypothetical protein
MNNWDAAFSVFGGRVFTLGALAISLLVGIAVILLAPGLFHIPQSYGEVRQGDIDAFIRAGELAVAGEAARAYDPEYFIAPFVEANAGLRWFYAPQMFLIAGPLSQLPFIAIRPIWIALSVASAIAVVWRVGKRHPIEIAIFVISPAMLISLMFFQVGSFVAIGLATALLVSRRRPIAAGIILGLLTVKPQYGLLVPVFLAATGQWRVFMIAAATGVALAIMSFFVFGASTWKAFFDSIGETYAPFAALKHPATVSAGQLFLKLGATPLVASITQALTIGLGVAVTFIVAKRLDPRSAIALTLILSVAVAPSAWTYDWPLVAAGLLLMANAQPNWPIAIQVIALFAWAAPAIAKLGVSNVMAPVSLFALAITMTLWLMRMTRVQAQSVDAH